MAVKMSNNEVGGRVLEMSGIEYMVRGRGYLASLTPRQVREAEKRAGVPPSRGRVRQGIEDLNKIAIRATATGTPVYPQDIADVHLGPELRRGIAEAETDLSGDIPCG